MVRGVEGPARLRKGIIEKERNHLEFLHQFLVTSYVPKHSWYVLCISFLMAMRPVRSHRMALVLLLPLPLHLSSCLFHLPVK